MEAVKVGENFTTVYPTRMTQVVDPAANTAGVYLRTATLITGGGTISLYTSRTAPTRLGDPSVATIFGGMAGSNNLQYQLAYPLFIPVGYGLWTMSNIAGAAIALTWDFAV